MNLSVVGHKHVSVVEIRHRNATRVQAANHSIESIEQRGRGGTPRKLRKWNGVDPDGCERDRAEAPQEGSEAGNMARPFIRTALPSGQKAADRVARKKRPCRVVLDRDAPSVHAIDQNVGLREVSSGDPALRGEADECPAKPRGGRRGCARLRHGAVTVTLCKR